MQPEPLNAHEAEWHSWEEWNASVDEAAPATAPIAIAAGKHAQPVISSSWDDLAIGASPGVQRQSLAAALNASSDTKVTRAVCAGARDEFLAVSDNPPDAIQLLTRVDDAAEDAFRLDGTVKLAAQPFASCQMGDEAVTAWAVLETVAPQPVLLVGTSLGNIYVFGWQAQVLLRTLLLVGRVTAFSARAGSLLVSYAAGMATLVDLGNLARLLDDAGGATVPVELRHSPVPLPTPDCVVALLPQERALLGAARSPTNRELLELARERRDETPLLAKCLAPAPRPRLLVVARSPDGESFSLEVASVAPVDSSGAANAPGNVLRSLFGAATLAESAGVSLACEWSVPRLGPVVSGSAVASSVSVASGPRGGMVVRMASGDTWLVDTSSARVVAHWETPAGTAVAWAQSRNVVLLNVEAQTAKWWAASLCVGRDPPDGTTPLPAGPLVLLEAAVDAEPGSGPVRVLCVPADVKSNVALWHARIVEVPQP